MNAEPAGTLDFDVAIVGGRPAGASLAARLGARGVRVLVVDRAELHSQPAVPSCPVVYPSSMRLLDEIGMNEAEYSEVSGRIRLLVIKFHTHFDASFPLPMMFGRDYVYGIDRAHFDHALWAHLAKYPSVTARRGFAFQDLVRDEGGQVVRWMLTDPEYQERFVRFLGRDIPPETWMTPALMRACAARGVVRDLRSLWS